ncbi:MAG: hypothetical protein ACOCWV_03350 [Planctomycetota bacterium]
MRRTTGMWMIVLAAACVTGGCASHTEPVVDVGPRTDAERNFQAVWDASLTTLREWGWEIAYADRRAGRIVTQPMTGKQFWEFWREDAATRHGALESSLQTIFRQAHVTVRRREDAEDQYAVTAYVTETRSNRPQPQLEASSEAILMFRGGGVSPAWMVDYGRHREQQRSNLGLNAPLSKKLTGAIHQQAGLAAPAAREQQDES